jgi:hypothetical protein
MGATTTTGAGISSVRTLKPSLINGVVQSSNIAPNAVQAKHIDRKPVNATAATLTVTEANHANKIIVLDRAAGITATLPAANGTGNKYTFMIKTTVTSNTTVIKVANATDTMAGCAIACADGGASVNGWECAGTSDTITFDGSTTGGIRGDTVELTDIAAGIFVVNAFLSQTATEATPFSATVS